MFRLILNGIASKQLFWPKYV